MEPLNPMWLKEPVPADNVDGYKTISQETSTPIVGVRILFGPWLQRFVSMKVKVDFIMPDLQKCGGLGEGQRHSEPSEC